MINQKLLKASKDYKELDAYLNENMVSRVLLVCDSSLPCLPINDYFDTLENRTGIKIVKFNNITPNPLYTSVVEGIQMFHKEECNIIIAVGGGSVMDVAKCIKLYSNMEPHMNYLEQRIVPNELNLLAVPTTAGTGSEATRYAVIYYEGEKQSISDDSCIPSTILMDASVLKTLPIYQKKATMMDALCHAIEAFWSVNSSEESKALSKKAIQLILENKNLYLSNEKQGNENMLMAAYIAGKAINISQTTAGHAMCYKLTSLYGIAHGHAAALCISKLWPYMIQNIDKCIDCRGKEYLRRTFIEIAEAMNCQQSIDAAWCFQEIVKNLELEIPIVQDQLEYNILKKSVNLVRLKNNPVRLDENSIDVLYHQILKKEMEEM